MSAIAQLKALLGMDTGNYKAGMRDAEGATKKFQGTLKSVGRMLGVAFSVGTVIQFGRSLVTWASNASEAAQNAGVLTSEMIALNRVGLQAGLQVGDMGTLLEKLQNRLYEAAKGNKDATDSFAQIGLSVADLAGMDPAAMLEAVAKAAADSNIPLQTLSDIFGEKLGTKAKTALMDIAENGLPAVDAEIGDTADAIEAMGDRWAEMGEIAKSNLMQSLSWLDKVIGRAAAFWRGVITTGSWQGGKDMMAAGEEARQEEIDKRRKGKKAKKAAAVKAVQDMALNQEGVSEDDKLAAYYDKQAKKRKEVLDKYTPQIDRLRGQLGSAQGGFAGIQVDQMARMGGSIGANRAGLNISDRGFALAKESKDIQADIRNLTRQMNDRLAEINDNIGGGAL